MASYEHAVKLLAGAYRAHRSLVERPGMEKVYEFSLGRYAAKVEVIALLFGKEEAEVNSDALKEYERQKLTRKLMKD